MSLVNLILNKSESCIPFSFRVAQALNRFDDVCLNDKSAVEF